MFLRLECPFVFSSSAEISAFCPREQCPLHVFSLEVVSPERTPAGTSIAWRFSGNSTKVTIFPQNTWTDTPLSSFPLPFVCPYQCICRLLFHFIYFKNTKNLFIHIALIPEGDNPRVHPNILKCLLHSPVAKGYRLVVIASRAMVCKTPTYYLILYPLAFARGCVILRSHILFPLLLILLISHHI